MTVAPSRRAYMKHRALMRERGLWKPRTDAEPVRAHVVQLRQAGLSLAVIAELADVTIRSVVYLIYGEPSAGKAPSSTMPTEKARKLLAVKPTLDRMRDTVAVDASGTKRRIQALAALGWSARALALRCGRSQNEFTRILNQDRRVLASTARLVRDLYDELWDQPAPTGSLGERISASRALTMAARNGWPRPQAWDDDLLDLTDAELKVELRRQVEEMSAAELHRCRRARQEHGDLSPLVVEAVREYRRRRARQRKQVTV